MVDDVRNYKLIYALTYISSGGLAFFLPTRELSEIIVRTMFIILGLSLLIPMDKKKTNHILLSGMGLIVGWIIFATTIIMTHWDEDIYKIHMFWIPYMVFFAIAHIPFIKGELDE